MSIVYICDNCNKKFKLREFMKLEAIYTSDDRCKDVPIVQGRKCDSCGQQISADDKVVSQ